MIRRILCWLGWHEWKTTIENNRIIGIYVFTCCKHCGKVKR